MRTFNEQISNEKDTNIRKKLEEIMVKSISFDLVEFNLDGTSKADVQKYVHRTEKDITYGFVFKLNLGKPAEVAKWIIEIDNLMNKLFGKGTSRKERVIGGRNYVETGDKQQDIGTIDGKSTRVQLPVIEYWYDPGPVESSDIYKNLAKLDKYNI